MIRSLPLPKPRRRRYQGGGLLSKIGKKLRPVVKQFLRQATPQATRKLKEIGSKLIEDGGTVLTKMAAKKMVGGHVTDTPSYINGATPTTLATSPTFHRPEKVKPQKRRKKKRPAKKITKVVRRKKGGRKKGKRRKKGGRGKKKRKKSVKKGGKGKKGGKKKKNKKISRKKKKSIFDSIN